MYTNYYDEMYGNKLVNTNEISCKKDKKSDYKCRYSIRLCKVLKNSHERLRINDRSCEYKMDFILDEIEYLKIEGKVFDSNEQFIEGAIVTLYEFDECNYTLDEIELCDAITDCQGEFVFLIDCVEKNVNYKVKVN